MPQITDFLHRLTRFTWCAVLLLVPVTVMAAPPDGATIYQQKCASCHGPKGEGVQDEYPDPLAGDKSLKELTQLIDKTMPEGDPKQCVGAEAEAVAAYIYDAFYSRTAQARNKPARVELVRLTVRQYENALADLMGAFLGESKLDGKEGLKAEYYKTPRFRNGSRVIERIDPQVHFSFGEAGPDPKIDGKEFSIRWQGSVTAPDTGDYEFIVRTENGFRLFVNDVQNPLIDAWVKSGNDTEFRGSIRLLGGRSYPLKLEYFKSKQKTASISLEWKRPGRVTDVIAGRLLSPVMGQVGYVVTTPFPPDDRSLGYERGSLVSKAWDQATTDAAIEAAHYVTDNLARLSNVANDAPDRDKRLRAFCAQFAERAFRRPLTDEQRRFYVDRIFDQTKETDAAVKRVVLFVLKSPRFLYEEFGGAPADGYQVASRLALSLWDSLPDRALLAAAAKNQLATQGQARVHAERMIADARTRAKLRVFFHQWLMIDHFQDISRDAKLFGGFDEQLVSDLRTSLDLFLDDVVWSDASDFRQLLLADFLFMNGRLAKFYGVNLPPDAPFQKVPAEAKERSGVISHPFLLTGLSYYSTSSPIHRGVFIARNLLGRTLRPPPQAVTPLPPDLHAGLTTRERVKLQTSPLSCQSCHAMINPLGFSLENFDAVGRYRPVEKSRPIDASGAYQTSTGEIIKFQNVRDLAVFLAQGEETQSAFVEQMFHFLVKQPIRAYGPDGWEELKRSFVQNGYNIRKLVIESAVVGTELPKETATDKKKK